MRFAADARISAGCVTDVLRLKSAPATPHPFRTRHVSHIRPKRPSVRMAPPPRRQLVNSSALPSAMTNTASTSWRCAKSEWMRSHLPKQPDTSGRTGSAWRHRAIIDCAAAGQGLTEATPLHVIIIVQIDISSSACSPTGLGHHRSTPRDQSVLRCASARLDFLSGIVTVENSMRADPTVNPDRSPSREAITPLLWWPVLGSQICSGRPADA